MNLLAQGSAINKFHRDEVCLIVVPNLEDLRNIRMAQGRRRLSFANETLHPISVRGDVCGKNLQRDSAIEFGVLRQINFAHSARAEKREDFVMAEARAFVNRHFFKSAVQLRITVGGGAFGSPISVPIRNRCPSGETSNSWKPVTNPSIRVLKRAFG